MNNTEVNLVPADMREPVFEFIRPPVYHPPQVKFPHRQPLRYLDRYRDGKEHTYGIYWETVLLREDDTHYNANVWLLSVLFMWNNKAFFNRPGIAFSFFFLFLFFYLIWNNIFSPTRTFIVSFEWFCFDTKHDWRWAFLGGMGRL